VLLQGRRLGDEARETLNGHLGTLEELARFIVAHVTSVVVGDERVIESKRFVEGIDLRAPSASRSTTCVGAGRRPSPATRSGSGLRFDADAPLPRRQRIGSGEGGPGLRGRDLTGPSTLIERAFTLRFSERSYPIETLEGRVPEFVRGTYYSNGPSRHAVGALCYRHLLDGDGMLRSLRFEDGGIRFANRFVRSRKYCEEQQADAALSTGPSARAFRATGWVATGSASSRRSTSAPGASPAACSPSASRGCRGSSTR